MALRWEDYFLMALGDKPPGKMPDLEAHFPNSAIRLLEKKQELVETDQALQAQKEEFQVKMESWKERQAELELKEKELKNSIIRFDKFLVEDAGKRNRAQDKAAREQQIAGRKEAEAAALREEASLLRREKERLKRRLEACGPFVQYLERVLAWTGQFQEVPELLARFGGLVATQAFLLGREQAQRREVELERLRLHQCMEERSDEILRHNNQLAQLRTQLERARARTLKWEAKWTRIQNTAARKTLLLGQIKMASFSLFQLVRSHTKRPPQVPLEDTEGQLDKVQQYMKDLSDILADLRGGRPGPPPH
ncbi:cilia- and flagella-associated protein 73 [Ornithorhynchus anatinus]|uniref:cilia- and flagella-associated protein 73 n=1 Tax=Ornithorhynchus anatinus TaxID=9258 RepID=UPI0010A7E60A|nr:cilia- and flagella-associated protein 73 [Ornithorhynchus anatinus]